MSDIYVLVLTVIGVVLCFDGLRLSRRVQTLKRQLEEEKAYNEMADAKVSELGTDRIYLEAALARLTQEHEQLHWRYVQLTREKLAENYVFVHRNVTRKGAKSGN